MSPQPPNELIRALREHGVPFVVIGGHAVSFHGYVRATEDLDVVWARSPQAETALLAALTAINASWISDDRDPATGLERLVPVSAAHIRAEHLIMLVTDHGFLDLFDYVPGCPEADVAQFMADSVEADGVRYCSLAWLRRMKHAAGRPRDVADLENLP